MPNVLQVRPDVPGELGPDSSARGFNQQSRVTRARVRGPAVSTSCPGRLRPGSEVPWCRTTPRGASLSGQRARRVDQLCWRLLPGSECLGGRPLSRVTRGQVRCSAVSTSRPGRLGPMSQVPRDPPDIPGYPGPGSSARGVDQHSRATRVSGQVPARSISSTRQLGPIS